MDISVLKQKEQHKISDKAYELLAAADNEFVPPLSSRKSSTQRDFSKAVQGDSIKEYFEQLKSQRFASVFEEGELIAFVSFKENYTCSEISENELPNIYLSTLVVSPKARGKGVTTALYQKLFTEYEKVNIFTRTWSTNFAHIKILGKYGFEVIKVLKDDRGVGIDTIYFKKAKKS